MRSQRAHSNLRSALLLLIAISALALLCPPPAHAGTPCCDITAIDARTGVVTARVNATGQTFQFNAGSALRQLRVGQSIYANLATKQVSVNGLQPCCQIITTGVAPVDGVRSPAQSTTLGSTATSSAAGNTLGAQAAKGAVNPGEPCCGITSIDSSTGVASAKVNSTGQTFQFNAGSMLSQLHVGQSIYANLATKQVSVNGVIPCCQIINVGVAPVDGVRSPAQSTPLGSTATSSAAGNTLGAQAAKGAVNPGGPCCDITGIDSSTGVVTAEVKATGQSFQFSMNNAAQLHSLQVGQGLYANFKSNHVSLDGKHSSGRIVSSGAAAASQSTTSSQTGSTQPSGGSDQPKYARVNGSAVGGPTVFGGNETLEEATRKCQATCDAEGQQHNPPMACTANVAQTNPGQYSCACKCDQVGSGTDGSKSGGITTSGGPTVGNTLSAPAPAQATGSSSTASGIKFGQQPVASSNSNVATLPTASVSRLSLGSSGSSGSGACQAAAGNVTVCSPISGSTTSSPVQFTAAAVSNNGIEQITAMNIFVDGNSMSAYLTNTASLNTSLPMSIGPHSIVVRALDAAGTAFEKSLSVTVNSTATGSSANSSNSGTPNPQPVSYSCDSTPDPAIDACGKTLASATNIGAVTCGSSITITGIIPPPSVADWLVFQVTTPRVNCASLVIYTTISYSTSYPYEALLEVVTAPNVFVPTSAGGFDGPSSAGLGTAPSPLQPGSYYIRVHATQSAAPPGTWTLKITG